GDRAKERAAALTAHDLAAVLEPLQRGPQRAAGDAEHLGDVVLRRQAIAGAVSPRSKPVAQRLLGAVDQGRPLSGRSVGAALGYRSPSPGSRLISCGHFVRGQNKPTVRPSESISTFKAAGALPSPGICWMSPHSGTTQPAPVYARRSRTWSVKSSGAFSSVASADSDRCVLAMQIGSPPRPSASNWAIRCSAAGYRNTSLALYTRLATASI